MADKSGRVLSVGTIFVIIIAAGLVIGALLGLLRAQTDGSALLTGGLAGLITGGLAAFLFSRRNRALKAASRR